MATRVHHAHDGIANLSAGGGGEALRKTAGLILVVAIDVTVPSVIF